MCSTTNDISNSFGWAAGAKIYPESNAEIDSGKKKVSHDEIDELARRIEREIADVTEFLEQLDDFEERPKDGVVSTDKLINELKGR